MARCRLSPPSNDYWVSAAVPPEYEQTVSRSELSDIILVAHSYAGMVVTGVADRPFAGQPPGLSGSGRPSLSRLDAKAVI